MAHAGRDTAAPSSSWFSPRSPSRREAHGLRQISEGLDVLQELEVGDQIKKVAFTSA